MDVQDKIVLVTGGARRLGRELTIALARAGAKVALHYRSSFKEAQETASLIRRKGGTVEIFQADLSQKSSLEKMVRAVEKKLGGISILVNNASIFERTPFEKITEKDWEKNYRTHLLAPFWLSYLVAPGMKKRKEGKIINIADRTVFRTYKNYLPYVVTKAAIASLTKTLALELAPEIQVNAIAPGLLLWPEEKQELSKKRYVKNVPLRRIGSADDFVKAILALIELDFATGAILPLDGGISL